VGKEKDNEEANHPKREHRDEGHRKREVVEVPPLIPRLKGG